MPVPTRQFKPPVFCLNAADSTETGTSIDVADFKHILLEVSSANSANLTCKFQGSVSSAEPTFSSAASATNHWSYVATIDLEDSSNLDGDTGVVLAGSDDVQLRMVNVDGLKWFNATVTARSAGDITVKVAGFNEQ